MYRIFFFLLTALVSTCVHASQRYDVKDGDQVSIVISKNEVSRLAIAGEGRLKKVWSPEGYLDLQADKSQGEAFFKATPIAPQTFSFFARDDFGNTFTIVATQQLVPSQTVILTPLNQAKLDSQNTQLKSLPYKQAVNKLFKAMYNNLDLSGYVVSGHEKDIPVWKETKIKLIKVYSGRTYQGDIYEVTNISGEAITFHESEFFGFGDNVLAAGLEKLKLSPKQTTRLFVVRSPKKENS